MIKILASRHNKWSKEVVLQNVSMEGTQIVDSGLIGGKKGKEKDLMNFIGDANERRF